MSVRRPIIEVAFTGITALTVILVLNTAGLPRLLSAAALVFVLPGGSFLAAWFPRRLADSPGNLLLTLTLSLAIAVIGGLLLNLTAWGLQAQTWALWLGGITFLNLEVALLRDRQSTETVRVDFPFRPVHGVMLLAALFAFAALTISRTSAIEQPRPGFTQLWLMPTNDPRSAQLGIHNQEGEAVAYRLVVVRGGIMLQHYDHVEVQADQTWQQDILLPPDTVTPQRPFQALLYRLDEPEKVYRAVNLWLPDDG